MGNAIGTVYLLKYNGYSFVLVTSPEERLSLTLIYSTKPSDNSKVPLTDLYNVRWRHREFNDVNGAILCFSRAAVPQMYNDQAQQDHDSL